MKTFKQFFTEQQMLGENRRDFLKKVFGGAAAAAVSNPVQIAAAVAKEAGAPWLKITLEGDFAIWGHEMVSPEVIGTLTQAGGKYVPGVSDDGTMTVDFNDSAVDMVQVYVKPGTNVYDKLKGGLEDEEFDIGNITAEFDREVFKAMTGSDSSVQWYEDQIEAQTEREIKAFEELPDWQKDERMDVDGIDEEGWGAEASMEAVDQTRNHLRSSEDFDIDIPEEIKAVIERGYMKSYALGAGSGNESVSMDSLEKLRELTGDEDLEDPDEDDLYRWLEGEADGVWDTYNDGRADWKDDYQRDMDQVTGRGEYEQQPGTGLDTSWDDGLGNVMSLAQVLAHAVVDWRDRPPQELKHLMIPTERDPDRVAAADTSKPLLIAYDGMTPIKILDGQHRLQKALDTGMQKVPVSRVDINSDPKLKQMFDPDKHEEVGQSLDPQ